MILNKVKNYFDDSLFMKQWGATDQDGEQTEISLANDIRDLLDEADQTDTDKIRISKGNFQ